MKINYGKHVSKCVTTIKCEGEDDILKQEQVVTYYEFEIEFENSYNKKLLPRQSMKALNCKNSKTMYNLIHCHFQLHIDIIATANNSTNLLFETVNIDQGIVGLLTIFLSVFIN